MKPMAIIAVVNNISQAVIDRFIWSVRCASCCVPIDIYLGSHENPQETFRKTTILNDLLRKTLPKYTVIVQTDIDMLIPPDLATATYNICHSKGVCYHCNYRHVSAHEVESWQKYGYKSIPWKQIKKLPVFKASGSWNGLHHTGWLRSHGFCEEIYNLGGPDTEFLFRSHKLNVDWEFTSDFPLLHISHSRRPIPKHGHKNLRIAERFPSDYNWLKRRKESVSQIIITTHSLRFDA